jgi:hypothetical protein
VISEGIRLRLSLRQINKLEEPMTHVLPTSPVSASPRERVSGRRLRWQRRVAACAFSLALAGCGGGGDEPPTDSERDGGPIATLLADDGSAMPNHPRAVPADAAAWTRSGRYADARQAEQLEHALGEATLRVDVACCGEAAVEQAIGIALAWQAAQHLPDSTPVIVRATDLRSGANAADRMTAAGYGNVWLVTR